MEYISFNGKQISKITLGTVQLGMNYGINNTDGQPNEEQTAQVLSAALNGGITALDTSSAYGTSEKVLGDYFNKHIENKPTIITKFRIMSHEKPLPKAQAEKKIMEQVENSLKNLGYNSLPLLLMHNELDLDIYDKTVIYTLKKLQREKLVEKVGISLNHFSYIDKVIESGIFEAVQIPLNMMDVKNSTGKSLEKLKKENIFVFVRSVFLQGLFFRNPDTLPDGILQKAKEPLKMVRKIAEEENMSVAGLALSYIRDLDGVSSLVMGAEKPEQVKENIELLKVKRISNNAREKITDAFRDVDERVLCPWLW